MTDFRPECTINLHVELRGKPAKVAWSCSIHQEKTGRVVLARRFLGLVAREEAELQALLFGLQQSSRFLQEKVEVRASFPLEGKLQEVGAGRAGLPDLKFKREEVARAWETFRLRRIGKITSDELKLLQETAELAYQRKRKRED